MQGFTFILKKEWVKNFLKLSMRVLDVAIKNISNIYLNLFFKLTKMKLHIILFVVLICKKEIFCSQIRTQYGLIEGFVDQNIIKYLGIPFASPPVGDLRFKEPKPLVSWSNTLKTTQYKSACIQNPKNSTSNPYMTPKSVE